MGQNLVPNSGFELVKGKLPNKKHVGIAYNCEDWFSSYMMSTDYYNEAFGKGEVDPKDDLGNQKPHSGEAFSGICIDKKFIEYLQTKLLDTLMEGKKYLIEFYICKAEISKSSLNEFGILFSDKANRALNLAGIVEEPSVKFINSTGYRDNKSWTKLSAVYQAKGAEAYLILGHFTYDHPYNKKYCHYYIDDVSITPIEKESPPGIKIEIENAMPTAKKETADSISQPFSPKIGVPIALKNIFFTSNESELLSESFLELNKLTQYLNKDISTTVAINGYTDNVGNEHENKILSEDRAKAVAKYLISKGIDKTRIKYAGYGSVLPINTNDTETGRQLNRRVEFTINKK